MELKQRMVHEIKPVGIATLCFGCWIAALVVLKQLILAEYQIAFHAMAKALVGTLILAKVMLVLEHINLGTGVSLRPVWMDVLFRWVLYCLGVLAVLVLVNAFEARHECNGLGLRQATFLKIDVYVAALYVPETSRDGGAILDGNAPRELVLQCVRDLGRGDLGKGSDEGFANNA
jgi:hypothetical protein